MKKQHNATPRFGGSPVDLVVDVRSKLEYWTGHLPGAVCIPGDQIVEGVGRRDGITTASRILVYCAGGKRSAAAAEQLREAGYSNVVDGGGITAASEKFAN